MKLYIYLRSTQQPEAKLRPSFFDKTACLSSLIAAAREVEAHITFVNDGPIPAERESLMMAAGDVVRGEFGSNRASLRATLALAATRRHASDDVVWFAEDDYLYTRAALIALMAAVRDLPADYFTLYTGDLEYRTRQLAPIGERGGWTRFASTTSTFGVRGPVLGHDVGLLRLMPFTGGAFDRTTWLTLAGRYPFTWRELYADLIPVAKPQRVWARSASRGVIRVVLGARALRRPSRRRALYGPARDLIVHAEEGAYDPADHDMWTELAASQPATRVTTTERIEHQGDGARTTDVGGPLRPVS
jgi:hypothetical protein